MQIQNPSFSPDKIFSYKHCHASFAFQGMTCKTKMMQPHFKQPEDFLQAGNLSVSGKTYEWMCVNNTKKIYKIQMNSALLSSIIY